MSREEPNERLAQLQREHLMTEELLQGKLSKDSRACLENLLQLIQSDIDRERQMMEEGQSAA
jgi:hypothetical protein